MATGIGVAAWAGLMALRRPASPERNLPPIAPIVAPPLPRPLPAATGFERTATPATARRENVATRIEVHVPAVPVSLRDGAAGIATYDADTGAGFVWLPLAEASTAADGSLTFATSTPVRGNLQVAFAAAPEWARHGYLARVTVAVGGSVHDAPLAIELPVVVDTVSLVLPKGAVRTAPLRLSRCDDARWLPTGYSATGFAVAPGQATQIPLGAGAYELIDPIDTSRRQRFDVPAAGEIVLTPALTAVRGDRP